jgi:hypothetical protein
VVSPQTAPKIAKLIRLLDSDQDGEALGAARGLRRVLESEGGSLHDLANWLEEQLQEPGPEGWQEIAEGIIRFEGELNDKERSFVYQMATLCARGFEPTAKQAQWLSGLYARVGLGEGAAV